jgi:hypothetical protein
MVAQLRQRGITVELDPEVYPNGRFPPGYRIPKATQFNSGNPAARIKGEMR